MLFLHYSDTSAPLTRFRTVIPELLKLDL